MQLVEVAEDLAIGSTVKTLQGVIQGNIPIQEMEWSLVDGKGSVDNASFTLTDNNDGTATITNDIVLASGSYYFRWRFATDRNSLEGYVRVYTDDKGVGISVNSTTYTSDIVVGDEVATVSLTSGLLTDVTIKPETPADDPAFPAMSYDGSTGKIEWTGDQSPDKDYTYNIIYNDGGCIKSQLTQGFELLEVSEISPSLCSYPGSGSQGGTVQRHRGSHSAKNSFDIARSEIQDSSHNQSGGLGSAIVHGTGAGPNSTIERLIDTFDTTTLPGTKNQLRFSWNANNTARTWYIYWKDAALPAVNNPTYDMVDAWNLLGSVTCPSSGTFGSIDLDVSSLPDTTTLQIGVATENDVLNSFGDLTDVNIGINHYRCSGIEMFGCP